MINITTNGGMINFQDTETDLTKSIGQNRLWVAFKGDTVNFLRVDIPTDGYDGTPFFSVLASNLTINGQSYTIEELKQGQGLSDLFSSMSFNIEIVDELPEVGDPSTIYLIYDDETGSYTEYLWLAQEQVWEQLGSVAEVDLGNYYNKSQVDQLLAAKANTSSLSTVATSGSYNDLSDKPQIPTVPTNVSAFTNDAGYLTEHQSLANYYNKSQTDNLLNGKVSTGTLATVATSGSYNDLTNKPDLSTKQDVLVSGVNIKTINSQSLLGEGNINIEGGGGGTQVQSNWNETDTTSMAYIQNKPTNVSAFTNDAGYLTSHQSLADVFADVAYDSATKRINFYGKGDTQHTTALAYVDASDFVVDGMVEDVRIENGNLVIDFNTDSGITDISIPLTDIFDPSNYYTKSEVDNGFAKKTDIPALSDYYTKAEVNAELAKKADTDNLATVATSGSYNDLSDKPIIPEGAVIDSALSDSSNNAVANRIVKGALDLKADKTEIPDMAEYYTSKEVDGMIEDFVTQKEVDDLTADFASTKDVDAAVDGAKPYVYQFNESSIETFDEAKTALVDNGRGLLLKEDNGEEIVYHPATWQYDKTGAPKFDLVYVDNRGNVKKARAQKATESRSPGYNTVKWTYFDITEFGNLIYQFLDDTVDNFDKAVEAYNGNDLIVVHDGGNTMPASISYDEKENALNLSWIDAEGNIVAYKVQKTGDGKTDPYRIEWTDVTPKPASIDVDTELSSTSTNPLENRAIYNVVGDIEQALAILNGTAS